MSVDLQNILQHKKLNIVSYNRNAMGNMHRKRRSLNTQYESSGQKKPTIRDPIPYDLNITCPQTPPHNEKIQVNKLRNSALQLSFSEEKSNYITTYSQNFQIPTKRAQTANNKRRLKSEGCNRNYQRFCTQNDLNDIDNINNQAQNEQNIQQPIKKRAISEIRKTDEQDKQMRRSQDNIILNPEAINIQPTKVNTMPDLTFEDVNRLTQSSCNKQKENNVDEKCYSVDYSFLDKISLDDENLQKILNTNLINNSKLNIEQLLDNNQDYFHHLFGNCACSKCTCGQCRCQYSKFKVVFKNGFKTSYSKDFFNKNQKVLKTPDLNQLTYESLSGLQKPIKQVDPSFTTTNQSFFQKPDPQQKFERVKEEYVKRPFIGMTQYKTQMMDWKDYDPRWIFKRPNHNSVVHNFPMYMQTSYAEKFKKDRKPILNATADEIKENQKNVVITDIYKGDKKTTKQMQFLKFNIKDVPNTYLPYKYHTQTDTYNPQPSFQAQFQTTNQNFYKGSQIPYCPSKHNDLTKPWKLKLKNKIMAFMALKNGFKKQN